MVLELEDDSAEELPVYEKRDSPERNNLIFSRLGRNIGPPKIYRKRLYTDIIGEQATGQQITLSHTVWTLLATISWKIRGSAGNVWECTISLTIKFNNLSNSDSSSSRKENTYWQKRTGVTYHLIAALSAENFRQIRHRFRFNQTMREVPEPVSKKLKFLKFHLSSRFRKPYKSGWGDTYIRKVTNLNCQFMSFNHWCSYFF